MRSDRPLAEIAPRLVRAQEAERRYQQRKADFRRRGLVPMDVAVEEMARSIRIMGRTMGPAMRTAIRQMSFGAIPTKKEP